MLRFLLLFPDACRVCNTGGCLACRACLKTDFRPTWHLAPHPGRTFRIRELERFFVEFSGEGSSVVEIISHQPNGTFVAKRAEELKTDQGVSQ